MEVGSGGFCTLADLIYFVISGELDEQGQMVADVTDVGYRGDSR
jgi:hypothetical protein